MTEICDDLNIQVCPPYASAASLQEFSEKVCDQLDNLIGIPVGVINMYAGTTAPEGWLLCYGQEVSRTIYVDLFAVIGTTYGIGDGATTFNLPDLRGRVPAGLDNMGGNSANRITDVQADVLGGSFGSETHVLIVNELAQHAHRGYERTDTGYAQSGSKRLVNGNDGTATSYHVTQNAGANQPHNNVQPSLFLNFIIKI